MKSVMGVFLVFLVAGCGSEVGDEVQLGELKRALTSDPWQSIFAVRRIDASHFAVNPVSVDTMTCPDGVVRVSCRVDRLKLGATGLSADLQTQIASRIDVEPPSEARISVLLKGTLVHVVDHRTNPPTHDDEFRASAAYWATSIRTHDSHFGYVKAAVQPNGFQPVTGVNSDLAGKVINITYQADINWVGPGSGPATFRADSFVAVVAIQPISGGGYRFDVDQIFRRVRD